MTRDPIGLAGGLNIYGFVDQNPLKYIDPTGEVAQAIPAGGILILGTAAFCAAFPSHPSCKALGELIERCIDGMMSDSSPEGKKATDSGKNSRHGDGGRATDKIQDQITDLQGKMEGASKKEKAKIKKKIQRIKEDATKKAKGEEHSRRPK